MANFIPRAAFPDLAHLPRSYFLGHHSAGLRKMQAMLSSVDLVVECRDYRVPLSSRNPMFEDALQGKQRIIVYTKKDLGRGISARSEDDRRENLLRQFYHPIPLLFHSQDSVIDTRKVLKLIKEKCGDAPSIAGKRVLIVGMPNVGKSSLLNTLREEGLGKKRQEEGLGKVKKAARTGDQPGVTRKIPTAVKIIEGWRDGEFKHEEDDVYVLDTPGVFVPYVSNPQSMLKLALTGAVKDSIIAPTILADYLLYHLNLRPPHRARTTKPSSERPKENPRYLAKHVSQPRFPVDKPAPLLKLPKLVSNPENPSQRPIKVLNPGSDPRSAPHETPPGDDEELDRSLPEELDDYGVKASELAESTAPDPPEETETQSENAIFPPRDTALTTIPDPSIPQVAYNPEVYVSSPDKSWYSYYHRPTNNVVSLLHAIAMKTGRLMALPRHLFSRHHNPSTNNDFHLPEESYRDPDNPDTRIRIDRPTDAEEFADVGGKTDTSKWKKRREEIQHPDIEASAVWLIQQWREGKLGKFVLDDISPEALMEREMEEKMNALGGLNRGKKIEKGIRREKSLARAIGMKTLSAPSLA